MVLVLYQTGWEQFEQQVLTSTSDLGSLCIPGMIYIHITSNLKGKSSFRNKEDIGDGKIQTFYFVDVENQGLEFERFV